MADILKDTGIATIKLFLKKNITSLIYLIVQSNIPNVNVILNPFINEISNMENLTDEDVISEKQFIIKCQEILNNLKMSSKPFKDIDISSIFTFDKFITLNDEPERDNPLQKILSVSTDDKVSEYFKLLLYYLYYYKFIDYVTNLPTDYTIEVPADLEMRFSNKDEQTLRAEREAMMSELNEPLRVDSIDTDEDQLSSALPKKKSTPRQNIKVPCKLLLMVCITSLFLDSAYGLVAVNFETLIKLYKNLAKSNNADGRCTLNSLSLAIKLDDSKSVKKLSDEIIKLYIDEEQNKIKDGKNIAYYKYQNGYYSKSLGFVSLNFNKISSLKNKVEIAQNEKDYIKMYREHEEFANKFKLELSFSDGPPGFHHYKARIASKKKKEEEEKAKEDMKREKATLKKNMKDQLIKFQNKLFKKLGNKLKQIRTTAISGKKDITTIQSFISYSIQYFDLDADGTPQIQLFSGHAINIGSIFYKDAVHFYLIDPNYLPSSYDDQTTIWCSDKECEEYFKQDKTFKKKIEVVGTDNIFYEYFVYKINKRSAMEELDWFPLIQYEEISIVNTVDIMSNIELSLYDAAIASIIEGYDQGIYREADQKLPMTKQQKAKVSKLDQERKKAKAVKLINTVELRDVEDNGEDDGEDNGEDDGEDDVEDDGEDDSEDDDNIDPENNDIDPELLKEILDEIQKELQKDINGIPTSPPTQLAENIGILSLGIGQNDETDIFSLLKKSSSISGRLEEAHPTINFDPENPRGISGPVFIPPSAIDMKEQLPFIGTKGGKTKRNIKKTKKKLKKIKKLFRKTKKKFLKKTKKQKKF